MGNETRLDVDPADGSEPVGAILPFSGSPSPVTSPPAATEAESEPCEPCELAERIRELRAELVSAAVEALRAGIEPMELVGLLTGEAELPAPARAVIAVLLKKMDADSLAARLAGDNTPAD